MIAFPDDEDTRRPYSIASSPLDTGYVEFSVGDYGRFAQRLFKLNGGETLLVSQAQGAWTLREDDRNAAFISVSAGLAPLRSMIRHVLAKGLPTKMTLFYEESKPSCILYKNELEHFERQGVEVHTTLTETEDLPEGEIWDGPTGPIRIKDIRKKVKDFKTASYYVCGPNEFVDAIRSGLLKAGVGPDLIRASKWGDF